MNTTQPEPLRNHERRIVDALEDHRRSLERVAAADGPFSDRAENALDWLEEHAQNREESNEGEVSGSVA